MQSHDNEIAVHVKDLKKTFRLPHESHTGLKQFLLTYFKKNKVKGYELQNVLKGVSFDVKKGDFFGIVGRNGSGKSTLLKLLAGIYEPDGGSVVVNGSIVPFIELGVGFNPELTGRENVFLNGALLGFSNIEMQAMYDEIVDFAELHKFMDQKLKNYSSGMQVRLAFSIAIQAKGDVLILDEVLAVGDEAFQKKCNVFFDEIKKNKSKTVILVTHGMDAVRRYCNKALLLESGKIVAIGDPNDVADEYSKQFIVDTDTSTKQEKRFGTGEVVFESIKHTLSDEWLTLDFDIKNKTSNYYDSISMGFDFCISDEIVIGNDTRYLDEFKSGITLEPNQGKHFTLKFQNNFGNNRFTMNTNITTEMGINVSDYIRGAFAFDSNKVGFNNCFKVLTFPEISQEDLK